MFLDRVPNGDWFYVQYIYFTAHNRYKFFSNCTPSRTGSAALWHLPPHDR